MAAEAGEVRWVDSERIEIRSKKGSVRVYNLIKFRRSNQCTVIHQRPLVSYDEKY